MRKPGSMKGLEELGRVRLSPSFFMRDFLYSEISVFYGIPNIPDNPDLAIAAGSMLCREILEPLKASFGDLSIRSSYRNAAVNAFGNANNLNCASPERAKGRHVWDHRDENGHMGAMACVLLPWFTDRYAQGADWRSLAWWIHDHLPYSRLQFFPKLCAFNISWSEAPERHISSYVAPRGLLTKPGMGNFAGDHGDWYQDFPSLRDSPAIS
ncbi:MAG: hypothetical protein HOK21_02625 [Rhodospirillaceae bacterium]|jgi:hypothetical protein|nr:hypothetical protein [Rhodospirillaceae bacterium]MBT4043225.1 hypothetical protein [Rhodospirillaceae bacterium]MBT4690755.1 hypothetical protein [Rhodospirillaceae bacterium]MBT5078948.1 hypothetical protein [Rhodospirillaceae bacterium]MBT5522957.1 hypothetical protein [Rhodospirillaceae bacterium]